MMAGKDRERKISMKRNMHAFEENGKADSTRGITKNPARRRGCHVVII
jgi:hypothetical protein